MLLFSPSLILLLRSVTFSLLLLLPLRRCPLYTLPSSNLDSSSVASRLLHIRFGFISLACNDLTTCDSSTSYASPSPSSVFFLLLLFLLPLFFFCYCAPHLLLAFFLSRISSSPAVTEDEPNHFEKSGIEYLHCPIADDPSEDISEFFHPATDFIHARQESGQIVLVHCRCVFDIWHCYMFADERENGENEKYNSFDSSPRAKRPRNHSRAHSLTHYSLSPSPLSLSSLSRLSLLSLCLSLSLSVSLLRRRLCFFCSFSFAEKNPGAEARDSRFSLSSSQKKNPDSLFSLCLSSAAESRAAHR